MNLDDAPEFLKVVTNAGTEKCRVTTYFVRKCHDHRRALVELPYQSFQLHCSLVDLRPGC
jgi:hypothetical protein